MLHHLEHAPYTVRRLIKVEPILSYILWTHCQKQKHSTGIITIANISRCLSLAQDNSLQLSLACEHVCSLRMKATKKCDKWRKRKLTSCQCPLARQPSTAGHNHACHRRGESDQDIESNMVDQNAIQKSQECGAGVDWNRVDQSLGEREER